MTILYGTNIRFPPLMKASKLLILIMLPMLLATATASGAARQSRVSMSAPRTFRAPLVPYAEDHFRDIATMRYENSPYYIGLIPGDTVIALPDGWAGRKVMLHRGGNPEDGSADSDMTRAGSTLHLDRLPAGSYLYSKANPVTLRSVTVTTQVDTIGYRNGRITIEAKLDGLDGHKKPAVAVEFQLFDPTRHQLSAARADGEPTVSFLSNLPQIQPWNHEFPYSYMVAVILRDDITGAHIETMGVPLDFASQTQRAQRTMLNSRPVNVFGARVDTIPDSREMMAMLLLHLREMDYNAVLVPDPEATSPLWQYLCRSYGMLLLQAPQKARQQGPFISESDTAAGILEANRRITVDIEEPDGTRDAETDSTLTLAIANRYDFTPINGFHFDWQLMSAEGRKLAGASDTLPEIAPHDTGILRLEGARYPLPLSEPEAFLDYTVTTRDGELLYAHQTVLRGIPAPVVPVKVKNVLRKLKLKDYRLTAGNVSMTFDPTSGVVTSIKGSKGELLSAPLSLTLDSANCRTVLTSIQYHKASRTATTRLDVETMQGELMGTAVIDYTVSNNGALNVACRYTPEQKFAYMRPALWFRSPAEQFKTLTYLGCRYDSTPAERATPRIANYRSANTRSAAANDVRRLEIAPAGVTVTANEPYTFEMVPMAMQGQREVCAVGLTLRPAYTSSDNFSFTLRM